MTNLKTVVIQEANKDIHGLIISTKNGNGDGINTAISSLVTLQNICRSYGRELIEIGIDIQACLQIYCDGNFPELLTEETSNETTSKDMQKVPAESGQTD